MSKRPEFRAANRLRKIPGGVQIPNVILGPNGKPARPVKMNLQHVAVQIIAAVGGKMPLGHGIVVGELPDFAAELASMEKWLAEQGEDYVPKPVERQNLEAMRMIVRWNSEGAEWADAAKKALNAKELDLDA